MAIPKELLAEHGVVSAACAAAMAFNVREKLGTHIGVGLTGAAGPEAHGNEPAGTVWIGISIGQAEPITYRLQLLGTRNTNRLRAVKFTYSYLMKELQKRGYK